MSDPDSDRVNWRLASLRSRFRGVKRRTGSIPAKTYNILARYIPEEVVVPLLFISDSKSVKWGYSVRSSEERTLPEQEASLMERMRFDERLLKKIEARRGKKHEKLIKVCHRCFCHELGYGAKGFKERVSKIFEPRAAFEYMCLQLKNMNIEDLGTQRFTRKRKIYGVVFEQIGNIKYNWNHKEISAIRLTTSRQFKKMLISQVWSLIHREPPGDRENLKWLINRVVDLNFDFGPYNLPLRSAYRKSAKDVYVMPISSKNDDPTPNPR